MNEAEVSVDFFLAGQLRLVSDGETTVLGTTLLNEIMALLLLRANSAVSVAQIINSVWPIGGTTEDGVRSYIARIRRLLRGKDCRLERLPGRYLLNIDPNRIDVLRFRQLIEQAESGDRAHRRRLVDEAMRLCPSDALLTGFTRSWVVTARQEYEARWRAAALLRNRYWLEDGDHERLVGVLRRERAHESLDQRLGEDYLLALYRSGQTAEALSQYASLVQRLAANRVVVQVRLRRLGERIERQDPALDYVGEGPGIDSPDMLPALTTRVEGRHRDIRAMERHAADRDLVRVIGIYGSPGIGKTTLATAFAHRVKSRYPGGVFYAHLGHTRAPGAVDVDDVLESFLRALGLSGDKIPAERLARIARYQELVRRRAVLVILDDVGSTDEIVPLLPTGAGSLAIVTSRNLLTALTARHAALAVVLNPIDQAASVALLTRLAGLRDDWSPAMAQTIARACGGHPLALCLAGARLATQVSEGVESLSEALARPGRRIRTLDQYAEPTEAVVDVIGWSYHELPTAQAWVFRLLGLMPCASLDLAAVARLVDLTEDEARPILAALVAAHLVTQAGPEKYGMLDLIAEYAVDAAHVFDDEVGAAARGRLYTHFRDAARAAAHAMWPSEFAPGPVAYTIDDASAARVWLDDHRDEIVAAVRHPASATEPDSVIDLAHSLFRYLDHGGYLDQAAALQRAAADAARLTGDEAAASLALGRLGAVLIRRGQFDAAEAVLVEARDLSAAVGDADGQAIALGNLGRLASRRGRYARAIEHQSAALDLFRASGDRLAEARTLTNLGIAYRLCGDLDEALRQLERANALSDELDALDAAARASGAMAGVLRMQGRPNEAERRCQDAIGRFHKLGDRVGEASALSLLGLIRSDQARHREAIDLHEESLRMSTDVGDESSAVDACLHLGTAMLAAGRAARAVRVHTEALDRATALGDAGQVARAHACLAEDHAAQAAGGVAESLSLAHRHVQEALGRFRDLGVAAPASLLALADDLARE